MPLVSRVLDADPVATLADYVAKGGGRGLTAGRERGPAAVIEDVDASGLRGRGGAGFPTGQKWRTVAENTSPTSLATVVVNAAEGEPGTFKDRAIIRANPYRVLEGALVAAMAVGADTVVLGLKASFEPELARVRAAVDEVQAAGWADGVSLAVVEGPGEYLFGEETALLEVVAGRHPFPRIAAPFRQGVGEAGPVKSPAEVELAGPGAGATAAPTLVDNVETLANVALIMAEGPAWFRSVGTASSPGTIVCTVSGRTPRHGVGEFAMGTPLKEVIEKLGGGQASRGSVRAVLPGVANALIPASRLDTPLTYEDMQGIGSGLGSAGFIVFDETTDLVAVAHGVSRFLAVESCGQCTPCKQDGLALADLLDKFRRSEADDDDLAAVKDRISTVVNEARCNLAQQHELVLASLLELFPDALNSHLAGGVDAVESELIAPIVDLDGDVAVLDEEHSRKQSDWSFDDVDSGQAPADRFEGPGPDAATEPSG